MKCVLREVFNNSRNALYCLANQESQTRRLDESPKLSDATFPGEGATPWDLRAHSNIPPGCLRIARRLVKPASLVLSTQKLLGFKRVFWKQLTDRTLISVT